MVNPTPRLPTQRIQRGIFSKSLIHLLPTLKFLERVKLLRIINPIFLLLVRIYQRYISPYKGFSCAHRKLHHSPSCSEYFAINLQRYGITQAIPLQLDRFQNCKQANRTLKAQRIQRLRDLSSPLPSAAARKKRKGSSSSDDSSAFVEGCDCCCDIDFCDADCGDLNLDCGDAPCDCDCG